MVLSRVLKSSPVQLVVAKNMNKHYNVFDNQLVIKEIDDDVKTLAP